MEQLQCPGTPRMQEVLGKTNLNWFKAKPFSLVFLKSTELWLL